MNSKEALEKLFGSYVSSKCYGINYKQDDEYYNIIKQDLERLDMVLESHNNLFDEYYKCRKVIKILKDVLKIGLIEDKQKDDFVYYWLSLDGIAEKELYKGDHELLKEVLGNDLF